MTPKEEYEARNNTKLFDIGEEICCACPQNCGNSGVISSYDFKGSGYFLNDDEAFAYFETARKLTKLDKALK